MTNPIEALHISNYNLSLLDDPKYNELVANELAPWLKDNQHRFVFISYCAGAGGEFICNWLDGIIQPPKSNNNKFECHLPFQLLKDEYKTYTELARAMLDNNINQLDVTNEKFYVSTHIIKPWLKLFPDAKFIAITNGNYTPYIELLGNIKNNDIHHLTDGELIYYALAHNETIQYSPITGYSFWHNLPNLPSISYYTFEELFKGDWVNKEFNFDANKFKQAFIEWDKGNTKLLDNLKLNNIVGVLQPNQELYT